MSKFFIEHPVLANVLAIVIVVIGVVAIITLPVSQYPNVVPPTVMVSTNYPGASPQTVIDTVALPIELQVNGVDNMLYMSSTSAADGSYQLIVTFKIGMDPDTAQVLVQNRVSNAIPSLPMSVQAQGVTVQKKSTAILQIVTLGSPGGTYDAPFLSNYATINLVNELARLPGVANVNVFGTAKYAMRVWMDPRKLYAFGLAPEEVIKAIRQQSQLVAAGQTGMPPAPKDQDFQYTIDIQSRFDDPSQFEQIIVKSEGTAQGARLVRIKDIGRVRARLAELLSAMPVQRSARWLHRHLPDSRRQLAPGRQGSERQNGGALEAFPARPQIWRSLRYDGFRQRLDRRSLHDAL